MSNYNTLKTADTINAVSIVDGAITTSKLNTSVTTLIGSGGGPKVAAITYPGNDLAADTAGGQTITLTGTGFVAGCSVFIGTTQASVVTVVSATSVTFTTPALAAATYTLYLVNPDGGTATIVPGISYSGTPTWTTGAGSLASIYEYSAINNTITATGDGSIVYSVFSGTLPTGSSLNTTTGVITGTSPASAGATTYTFVIRATDAQLQDTDRTFSITINTDAVTWTTPAANSTVTLGQSLASTTTLLATSAASNAITYTANALPTGLSISGATVTGTPTVAGNTSSLFTATAATTGRTTTATINWTITVSSNTYFPYTTLLLSGGTSTSTFIADASTNNFALAIAGDTKPNNFNPYTPGYYSNYFDGTGDYLSTTVNLAIATGPFTMEAWVYLSALGTERTIFNNLYWQNGNNGGWQLVVTTTNNLLLKASTNTFNSRPTVIQSSSTLAANTWTHVAVVRDSNNLINIYFNGVSAATAVTYAASLNQGTGQLFRIGAWTPDGGSQDFWLGYISNARVVVGTAVYTGTFTPSTTPLTAVSGTQLLTCRSNRFVDNSTNAYAITRVGDTTVSPTTPFVPDTAYATYGSTYFDGTGDYLTVPSNAAFAMGSGDFTIEMWVYPVSIPTDTPLIDGRDGAGTAVKPCLFIQQSSNNFIYYVNGGIRIQGGTPSLKTWQHVALVRNSGSTKFYINGTQAGSTYTDTNNYLTCGYRIAAFNDGSTSYCLNGYISNVRVVNGVAVYTSAFTPPSTPLTAITNTSLLTLQTNQPANNSMFLDSSTNALAVTRVGNTSAGTFTPYGANWSNYFNGSSGNVSIPYNANYVLGTNDFTVECWVMFNDISANIRNLVSLGYGANGDGPVTCTWALYYLGSEGSNQLRFYRYNGSTDTYYTTSGFSPLDGVWYHIAVSRTGGNLRIFGNGVALYSGANSINYTAINTSDPLLVGLGYFGPQLGMNGPRYFNGYISNLRVINGTGIYSSGFTPPTAPLTAVTNTKLLACQSNRYVDNSSIGATVTPGGNTTIQRFSPFSPSAAYSTSTIGGSGYFDGSGDSLQAPSSASISGTGDFTAECWIYPTTIPGSYNVLGCSDTSGGLTMFGLNSNGTIFMGRSLIDVQATTSNSFSYNTWNHIAISRSSGTVRLFINGIQGYSGSITTNYNAGTVRLGTDGGGSSLPYTGYISNFRIITNSAIYTSNFTPSTTPLTAVSGTQLLLNYTNAGVYDSTMINSLETVGDAKILSTQTPYAGSYYSNYFDGTGDYLTAGTTASNFLCTGSATGITATLEAWVYPTAYNTGGSVWMFSSVHSKGVTYFNFGVVSGKVRFYWYDGAYNTVDSASTNNVPLNTWTHIAVTISGTTIKIYVNGTLNTTSATYTGVNAGGSGGAENIGVEGSQPTYFSGYISNYRLNNTVVYTSTFTPSITPLTAITGTNLLTCQSNRFVDNSTNAFAVTRTGDTSIQSFNPFQRNSGSSSYFDGTGDYLNLQNNTVFAFNTSDFTIEAWVLPTAYHTGAGMVIFDQRNTYNTSNGINMWLRGSTNQLVFSTNGNLEYAGSLTAPINSWTHVAVVKTSGVIKSYVNGILSTTFSYATSLSDTSACVGRSSDNNVSYYFQGYINDLRITKGVARYTSTFTPPTTAFIAK